jgi:hypothetical protein
VLTGGQTGVDTEAARAALAAGLPVHLVFPRGLRQEDGPLTPARRRALGRAAVHELASDDFRYRTWTCVYLADAVILIDPAGGSGCEETARAARSIGRPLLWLTGAPRAGSAGELIRSFLISDNSLVLMIAGCRGSLLAAGRQSAAVRTALTAIFAQLGPDR